MKIINIKSIMTFFRIKNCSKCSKRVGVLIGEKYRDIDGVIYCENCARANFKICDCCDQITKELKAIDNKKVCHNCFTNNTYLCDECGARKFELHSIYGDKVCKKCYKILNRRFHNIDIGQKKETSKTFVKNPKRGYCGVEIECLNSQRSKNCFIRKELKEFRFSQGRDGSLSCGGVEFSSVPMNGDLLINSIESFGKALNKKNYEVDKSCGLHIHLEVKHQLEFLKKLYLFYLRFEELFFDMLPKSRRSSEFCEKFKKHYKDSPEDIMNIKTLDEFKRMIYETKYYNSEIRCHNNDKRYCWVNIHSIFYRDTLEIRSHSGTIDCSKIINWIMIHQRVLEFLKKSSLKKIKTMKVSRREFLNIFSSPLQNYIKRRWKTFVHLEEKDLNIYKLNYLSNRY